MNRLSGPGEIVAGTSWMDTLAALADRHRRRHAAAIARQRSEFLGLGGTVGRWIIADIRPAPEPRVVPCF